MCIRDRVKKGCLASASIDYVALGERTGQIAIDIPVSYTHRDVYKRQDL